MLLALLARAGARSGGLVAPPSPTTPFLSAATARWATYGVCVLALAVEGPTIALDWVCQNTNDADYEIVITPPLVPIGETVLAPSAGTVAVNPNTVWNGIADAEPFVPVGPFVSRVYDGPGNKITYRRTFTVALRRKSDHAVISAKQATITGPLGTCV